MRMLLIICGAVALVAVTAFSDTARLPDSTATSAAVAVNTTAGDSMVSTAIGVDTTPYGAVFMVR